MSELDMANEYSDRFDQIRKKMVEMSYYKYGPARQNYSSGNVQAIPSCLNAIIGSACQFKDTNKPRLDTRKGFFSYKKVIFNPPATIVIWNDGSKTVVKCGPNDYYDPEKGLALCFMKRAFSNDNNKFHKVFNKALKDGSMNGYPPFPMTPVEFDEFYSEYLKLKEGKDADAN